MATLMTSSFLPILSLLLLLLRFGYGVEAYTRKSVSAIYPFGDSLVDTGNNNALQRVSQPYPPYEIDVPSNLTTPGRLSNAAVYPEFISSYLGLKKYIPAYFDKTKSMDDFMNGVGFGSSGSGYDPLTAQLLSAVSVQNQLASFLEYKSKLQQKIGIRKAEKHIRNALFVVNFGTNDLFGNYLSGGVRSTQYTQEGYEQFLLQNAKQFLQDLYSSGARRILVAGVAPIGCLPIAITTASNTTDNPDRRCIEPFLAIARDFSEKLHTEITALQVQFKEQKVKLGYADLYQAWMEPIQRPQQYGFNVTNTGCCGTGLFEVGNSCNPSVAICSDRSKYVFFDAAHPTAKTNSIIVEHFRTVIDALIKK